MDILIKIFCEDTWWQTIGLLALWINIIGFLTKNDKKFLIFMMISSLFWWIHFQMLWLLAASYTNFFDILKNFLALKYKKNKIIPTILIFIYLIIWIYTYTHNLISLIPIINSIASVTLIFYCQWIVLRIWFLCILWLWVSYNLVWHSIGWFASDIILFIAWVIGIMRILHCKNNKKGDFIKESPK